MTAFGFDSFLLLTPFLLLAVVALLGFVGCDRVFGLTYFQPDVENLQAVPGNSQVTLTWDPYRDGDDQPATDYHVVRSSGGGPKTDIDTISTNTTFVDTGLMNGTTYTYYVYGVSSDGNSGT